MLLFQSMQRGSRALADVKDDYDFNDTAQFGADGLVVKQAFGLPGSALTQTFDLRPEGKGSPAVDRAQEAFLQQHTQNDKVTRTVE